MALHKIEREYAVSGTTRRLTSPVANLLSFDIPIDGDIVEISVIGNTGSGTCTFSVEKNTVPLYAGAARPSIATTETFDTKTGLSDAVVFGDRISLSLVEISGSGLKQLLSFIVTIDDGTPAIGDLDDLGDVNTSGVADGDTLVWDAGTSTWVPGAGGGGGGAASPTVLFDDTFTGGTIDSAIWDTPGAGTSQGSGKLTITASSGEQLTSKSSIVIVPTIDDAAWHNKQITAKIPTYAQSGALATQFFISYAAALGTYYRGFQAYNGNLAAICQGQSLTKNVTFNATNHLWLRIRDLCGVTSFWTSPNGTDWTMIFAAEPNNGGLFDAYNPFYIVLRLYNVSGAPATIEFDEVKLEDLSPWFPN